MSVLVEFRGSRRVVTSSEDIISRIEDEIRKFDPDATVFISSDAVSDETVRGKRQYIVQRWSNDWNCFVDVIAMEEIKDGDRLVVIPKPGLDEVTNDDNSAFKFVSTVFVILY